MRRFPWAWVLLGGVAAIALPPPVAHAQGNGSRSIELDTRTTPPKESITPPPLINQQRMRDAQRLFDERRWADAAVLLHQVKLDVTSTRVMRETSSYELAIALHRMNLHQSAFSIFGEIADEPNHIKHGETLLWLGRLAIDLPEPADVIERVGKYDEASIDQVRRGNAELVAELDYHLARYKYRLRRYEDAVRLFGKVDSGSRHYVKAAFWSGLASVQLRKPARAVESFQRVVRIVESPRGEGESAAATAATDERMRDLAFLSIARTYYSAAHTTLSTGEITIDRPRLDLAVKYWGKVDPGGPAWLDALFEEAWAYFMSGDYPRALGNIHTLDAPYFPSSYYPEASVLKALVYFVNCHYTEAETLLARFQQKHQPMRNDLVKLRDRFSDDNQSGGGSGSTNATSTISDRQSEPAYELLRDLRDGRARLPLSIQKLAELTLSDRELARHLQYVQLLDDEHRRISRMPPSFRDSAVGDDIKTHVLLARDIAIRNTVELARERIQRAIGELDEQLDASRKLQQDILEARKLNPPKQGSSSDGTISAMDSDDEHVLWPFDGEYWRDELGYYKQSITSRCAGPK